MYNVNTFGTAAGDTIIASAKFLHLCVCNTEEFVIIFKYLLVGLLKYNYRANILCSLETINRTVCSLLFCMLCFTDTTMSLMERNPDTFIATRILRGFLDHTCTLLQLCKGST